VDLEARAIRIGETEKWFLIEMIALNDKWWSCREVMIRSEVSSSLRGLQAHHNQPTFSQDHEFLFVPQNNKRNSKNLFRSRK
jgi:hypothetical protein